MEKLQDFFHALYVTATQANPEVVMELCPCGTAFAFFNFASMNQAPASDPESSWQVRHKGKTLQGADGPGAPPSPATTSSSPTAMTISPPRWAIGAVVSTKFTWPNDPKPKDSFLLTPQHEALWRKWIALYNERMLPQGTYRGELYDIGFDKPEAHVVEKAGRFYYAFYAPQWHGPVTLRGLKAGRYRMRDYFNDARARRGYRRRGSPDRGAVRALPGARGGAASDGRRRASAGLLIEERRRRIWSCCVPKGG